MNLTRQSVEKEPRHEFGRIGTPGNEKELKLLPSPIPRHSSRASVKSQVDSTGSACDNSDIMADDADASESVNQTDLISAGSGGTGGNAADSFL
jgi:hypothetical protein